MLYNSENYSNKYFKNMRILVIFLAILWWIYFYFSESIILYFSQLWYDNNKNNIYQTSEIIEESESSKPDKNHNDSLLQYYKNIENNEITHNWNQTEVITYQNDFIDSVSPVKNIEISSFFWPRLQASQDYAYDFHRWIDYHHDENVEIYAFAKWEIYKTYLESDPNNPYKNSGTTVIIKHRLEKPYIFHGKEINYIYSLYAHLSELWDNIYNKIWQNIEKWQVIWFMWKSGTTDYQHLHFEIRVATTCSREYQLKNQDAQCSQLLPNNADPHVNPLVFLPKIQAETLLWYTLMPMKNGIKLTLETQNNYTDINRIILSDNKEEKIIDFNLRESINWENIDNNTFNEVKIIPEKYSTQSQKYKISFEISHIFKYVDIKIFDVWWNDMIKKKNPF